MNWTTLGLILNLAGIACFLIGSLPASKQPTTTLAAPVDEIQPGQRWQEYLDMKHKPYEESLLSLRVVVEVKDGYVKFEQHPYRLAEKGFLRTSTIEDFKRFSRRIQDNPNPFEGAQ